MKRPWSGFLLYLLAVLPVFFLFSSEPARAQSYQYVTQWGSNYTPVGTLADPDWVAVDPSGNIYIVDFGKNNVMKFSPV
jgi:hypothetical protein